MNKITNETHVKESPGKLSFEEFIEKTGTQTQIDKGQVLFSQESPTLNFYQINRGLIKLHKNNCQQKPSILKIEKDPGFVGLTDCLGSDKFSYTATAVTSCQLTILDAKKFNIFFKKRTDIALKIVPLLASESLYFQCRLISGQHKQLPGRVADTLLYFRELFNNSETFILPLSRTELAQFAGTTKESFIRTLTEFKNDKIINLNDRQVSIRSMEILKTLSRLG
ncbi:Crp/Fnr family transcriptional regulator [Marinilabilia rubra]|uniref:Crp/Fnr family transcriptional regulator n=1 Tax=Marinilabilia rubra TaxID=2162893 RepID=A0A2U2BCB5_9BACT|nr:Crp/Fnr family transcriptional regulator [Marinilabilia rubra]PWE00677.1 hypothetical protein DDZ16_03530 [Marinilabilia rubra]